MCVCACACVCVCVCVREREKEREREGERDHFSVMCNTTCIHKFRLLSVDYQKSRLFGNAPENIIHYLRNENVTENFHHDSVLVEEFFHNQRLSNFFHVLSVNKDRQGVAFLSTYEGDYWTLG